MPAKLRYHPNPSSGDARSSMDEETRHLAQTLVYTASIVAQCGSEDRVRIAAAYREARALAAGIPKDEAGDARPRILACLRQFETRKATADVTCTGWMLAAIQERVNERDLAGWRKLRKAVGRIVTLLLPAVPVLH